MPIMSEDEFNRLPPDVQQGVLDKLREEQFAALAYQQRQKKRALNAAAFAGLGSMVLTYFLTDSLGFLMAVAFACAAAGALTAWLRVKLLGGIMLVGGVGVLVNLIGAVSRLCAPNFFAWILYLMFGGVVGAWTDASRGREDNPF